MAYILIALSLVFTTAGQLLQKLAADQAHAAGGHFVLGIARNPRAWLALACLAMGTLSWLGVLYYMEVSRAFPFLSLGFVLVFLVSRHHLGEEIPTTRWAGLGLIVGGLILVASA